MYNDDMRKINNDRLGAGSRRNIEVSVNGTRTSLNDLIDAKVSGRTIAGNVREIRLRNTGAQTIFILESETQTIAEGVQIRTGEIIKYEASITAFDNTTLANMNPPDDISKTFFATAGTTETMTVEELA